MLEHIINWLIHWYYPGHVLIPRSELTSDSDEDGVIESILYDKVLALVRNIEGSHSLGENKRIYVKAAIQAERRKLDLPPWSERDINLAIELAIRKL